MSLTTTAGSLACSTRSRLTPDDLAAISTPTLLLFADRHSEVTDDHIRLLRTSLANSQLAIVPGTDHGLPSDRPEIYDRLVLAFWEEQTG